MPSYIGKLSNYTFNKNGQTGAVGTGWSQRVIFTCGTTDDLFHDTNNWYDTEDFDGIEQLVSNYGPAGTILTNISHGDAIFPAEYWKSGKTIRLKGMFWATSTEEQYLNMRIGMWESSPTKTVFSIQDDGNNHIFAKGQARANVPVFFEITLQCINPDDNMGNTFWITSGHYQYEYTNYSSGGTNQSDVFVPIHNTTNVPIITGTGYYYNKTRPIFNFYGSTVSTIVLAWMTIEELA